MIYSLFDSQARLESLVPVPREMASKMLNGELIGPEIPFVVHIPVDAVIDSIPSPEIVKKDIHQLDQLAKEYGTFMYLVKPLSFEITKSLAKGEDISKYKDQPSYYLRRDGQYEDATFTIKEFLDSIDSKKTKELMKEPESFQQRMIKKFGKK